MTRVGGSLRTTTYESAVEIVKTTATSSTIGGISGRGHRPLCQSGFVTLPPKLLHEQPAVVLL
jgi:hypothetical protein